MLRRNPPRSILALALCAAGCAVLGCGATRTTNTLRTATEQLLISDAVDRAVEAVDCTPLAGQTVFVDDSRMADVVDRNYLTSTLRQHLLASGAILKDVRDDATFVVEPRAGAVGTDNHDLLFGIPAVNLPQLALLPTMPAAVPEIPFAKRHNQRGVVKLSVFAYRRDTGEPAWQSGTASFESTANDVWVMGAGPFQRGSIYNGAMLAGKKIEKEKGNKFYAEPPKVEVASVDQRAVFAGAHRATTAPAAKHEQGVVTASANLPFDPTAVPPVELKPARPISEAPRHVPEH